MINIEKIRKHMSNRPVLVERSLDVRVGVGDETTVLTTFYPEDVNNYIADSLKHVCDLVGLIDEGHQTSRKCNFVDFTDYVNVYSDDGRASLYLHSLELPGHASLYLEIYLKFLTMLEKDNLPYNRQEHVA